MKLTGYKIFTLCHRHAQFYYFVSQIVATCCDHLYGHPQATRARKTKITIENFVFGQKENPASDTMHINKV